MRFLSLFLIFSLSSCKTLVMNAVLKDPKVETRESIKEFLDKNNFSSENAFVLKGDSSTVFYNLAMGFSEHYFVYDRKGRQLCYKGSSSCSGEQFQQFLKSGIDSFQLCSQETEPLDSVLKRAIQLNGAETGLAALPTSNYYVIVYWQKFMGGRKGYKESVQWMEHEINSVESAKVTFLKINTDMQEDWGLEAGRKAKLRWHKQGKTVTMKLTDLPFK